MLKILPLVPTTVTVVEAPVVPAVVLPVPAPAVVATALWGPLVALVVAEIPTVRLRSASLRRGRVSQGRCRASQRQGANR
jgi:hypothetical protein